jgi:hypothetical protein
MMADNFYRKNWNILYPEAEQLPFNSSSKAPWLFHWWLIGCGIYYFIGARELVENPWNFHIFNPPSAALAGHALILVGSFTGKSLRSPTAIARIAVLLLIIGGTGQKVLKYMYKPEHANATYKMGLALRQISQAGDLVVTIPDDIGDPVAIYYSQRRGWVFPPASNDIAWNLLPEDGNESIRMFEELRANGADWLGIVSNPKDDNQLKNDFWRDHPTLVEYIKRTCELKATSPDWFIYRILTPEEVAKFPVQP